MITLTKLDQSLWFPPQNEALTEPNGLLAFGGDLTPERLLLAYKHGIFPWFSEGEPIMWWSPDPRGIIYLDSYSPSKSLQKLAKKQTYQISVNLAFDQVIQACAFIPRQDSGTWITRTMIEAYKKLHRLGNAHSIEVWQDSTLVGGLYGVVVGKVFCGESMFHNQANCSKLALLALSQLLKKENAHLIDCQILNPHLASLGCIEVSRTQFLNELADQSMHSFSADFWKPRHLT